MKTAEEVLQGINKEMLCVSPETTLYETIQLMVKNKIGSILIKDGGDIIGIWTERDYLRDTTSKDFNPYTSPVSNYMQTKLHFAKHDDNIYQLMDKYLGLRIRHLPIKKGDKLIGLLSSRDVQREILKAKDEELKKMEKRLSWEYHEDWKW